MGSRDRQARRLTCGVGLAEESARTDAGLCLPEPYMTAVALWCWCGIAVKSALLPCSLHVLSVPFYLSHTPGL